MPFSYIVCTTTNYTIDTMDTLLDSLTSLSIQEKPCMQALLVSTLTPYATQKNTGNLYEITVVLTMLRTMGLTDSDLDANTELLDRIVNTNSKKQEELRNVFASIRTLPVGKGLVFDDHTIIGIQCATQDDSVGTGDLVLLTSDDKRLTVSICQGTVKRDNSVEKCLTNPSSTRFGCTKEDIEEFKRIEKNAVVDYKAFMTDKYGNDEAVWPSRIATTVATDACSKVSSIVETRFTSFSEDEKKAVCTTILQIKDNKPPADYLAVVHKETNTIRYFQFDQIPSVNTWCPRLVANGIYLDFYNGEKFIGKTQVKFNNGVYHKGKTSSICTSWNSTFLLTDLFKLKPITLPSETKSPTKKVYTVTRLSGEVLKHTV